GRVVLEPRVALGDRARVDRELGRKLGIEQVRVARAAAVMEERRDRPHAELAKAAEPLVAPSPVRALDAVWRRALPKYGVADGLRAHPGEKVEVRKARCV